MEHVLSLGEAPARAWFRRWIVSKCKNRSSLAASHCKYEVLRFPCFSLVAEPVAKSGDSVFGLLGCTILNAVPSGRSQFVQKNRASPFFSPIFRPVSDPFGDVLRCM